MIADDIIEQANVMIGQSTLESTIAKVSRETLADRVYGDVKELFLSGQIPPGERLTLRGLAAAVGTSPMPVRDAVRRLVAEKALDILPNRSVQVSWPTHSRFEELVLIRCNLEGLAAELAATRRTRAEVRQIRHLAKEFERCADPRSAEPLKTIRTNRLLHYAVYDAARMPTLKQMIEGLWLRVGPIFAATIIAALKAGEPWQSDRGPNQGGPGGKSGLMAGTHRWHTQLVEAVDRGDGAAAREAIVGDISGAADLIFASGRLLNK